ncbi:efflux RND transporter periplasmic adaptor subunit [Clostridium tunisiense]|uniref:efflux RND transporter periplasmic adaptor subunit n=1 Tax=Clostridium tunisiense TaxID=219748 RepID=UPI0002D7AFA3|nr:efflux RND transporter periplasmic adaptor subunit [Clostridium tunisiense]
MKKKVITFILITTVITGGIFIATRKEGKEVGATVKTSEVTQGDVKAYLSTTATIKSKNSKDYFAIQGKVKKVNVKVGDRVEKGQVLAEFEVTDPNIAVKQAQLSYDNAVLTKQNQVNSNNEVKGTIADLKKQISDLEAQIEEAKKNPAEAAKVPQLESQKAPLITKKDSLKEPFSSEQLKQSDNNIALQKLNLDNAKSSLSKSQSTLVADFNGVVTAVNLVEGATTTVATQPAITVQDVDNLKVVLSAGKYDASKIKLGQEAVIKYDGKEYKGAVSFIDPIAKKAPSAAGTETTLSVEIDIVDKAEGLKVDFDADVDLLLGEVKSVLRIPAESIRSDKEGKAYVFSIEGNKVVEKKIVLGLQSDMEAEVVEGITPGEKVILNPSTNMKSGEVVKEAGGEEK